MLKWILGTIGLIIITVTSMLFSDSFGESPKGTRLEKIKNSPQYGKGKFVNAIETKTVEPGKIFSMMNDYLFNGADHKIPGENFPILPIDKTIFENSPSQDFRYIWLGHSTIILEVEGTRLLIDPVFSERVSPFQWSGPKRFYDSPIALEDLPEIDAVIISHDHYDHLDHLSIVELAKRDMPFLAPLGVGAHLEKWGVKPDQVKEFDWWQETMIGDVKLVCTPARHFSGRGILDRDKTLWASWTILGKHKKIYYSGDSGITEQFKEIGDQFGPFDFTIMQIGAYNKNWHDIHLFPEEAIDAQEMLKGEVLIPVHWGTFDLALHSWYDPVDRLIKAAAPKNMTLSFPKVGEVLEVDNLVKPEPWWKNVDN
ncbi:MBL fold metallo-hydrolase [Flexithrix dorotheae]|uniref:MBL fold metallo-hydrolase n=1 Tax=Flexithrix dorotheae TaxID=70993 RepID=UPI0003624839|nr:MBL fold metallo-hydrolase [Flexithrix dorotheae]